MHWRDSKVGPFLGEISAAEHKAGRPLLTAVIIHKGNKIPGDGFYKLCKYLGVAGARLSKKQCVAYELGRVHEYWKENDTV